MGEVLPGGPPARALLLQGTAVGEGTVQVPGSIGCPAEGDAEEGSTLEDGVGGCWASIAARDSGVGNFAKSLPSTSLTCNRNAQRHASKHRH